jgi:aryl-alcohol dehydrogenase-like predicted oxidoreductase
MTFGSQNSERDAHEQLDNAVDRGINLVDTAEHYPVPPTTETQGRTESFIGSWLAVPANRRKVLIATKAVGPSHVGRISSAHIRAGNNHFTRENLESALHTSLTRLRTDVIDLYQLHWPDRRTNFFGHLSYEHLEQEDTVPLEETLAVLDGFVKAGKVRYIGVSNETAWGLSRYLHLSATRGLARMASIQNPYNFLNRSFDIGLAEIALRENVSLLGYSPLGFGVITGKYLGGARPPGARLTLSDRFARYNGEQAQKALVEYVALAKASGLDVAQMAIAWAARRRVVTSVIIGATSVPQLKTNIDSLDLELSLDVMAAIDAIHTRYPNPAP